MKNIKSFLNKEAALLPVNFLKYALLIFAAISLTLHFAGAYVEVSIRELTLEYYSGIPYHEGFLENIEQLLRGGRLIQALGAAFISAIIAIKLTHQGSRLRKKIKHPEGE